MSDTDETPCGLPLLLTYPQVAAHLGLSERQVYNLVAAGELERRKLGEARNSPARITRESLLAYVERFRVGTGPKDAPDEATEEP